jgi:hypothetical protein
MILIPFAQTDISPVGKGKLVAGLRRRSTRTKNAASDESFRGLQAIHKLNGGGFC